jgi:hypothetical protein
VLAELHSGFMTMSTKGPSTKVPTQDRTIAGRKLQRELLEQNA